MKIGIIGSGIAGLTLAHYLNKNHDILLFEKNDRLGGHTHTHKINNQNSSINVDSGFIVFNKKTYPNFLNLINELEIPYQKSEMSFSVRSKISGLEYGGTDLKTLFSQKKNLLNLKFWFLLYEIVKFNKLAKKEAVTSNKNHLTIGQFVKQYNFSKYFLSNYLLPMSSAIWSSSYEEIKSFSFDFFVKFLSNHGMININDRPQWYTIKNGSFSYVEKLINPFKSKIILNSKIQKVFRQGAKSIIQTEDKRHEFDYVFLACHANEALELLAKPSKLQQAVLSEFDYSSNDTYLHSDISVMPKSKVAWSSWNYVIKDEKQKNATVTYNMNILQKISSKFNFLVSLNIPDEIDERKVIKKIRYHHPIFNLSTYSAQKKHNKICADGIGFAGAYWGNGFHEDGVLSALNAIKYSGIN
jgi:predicted NAD/FAD-binding protein